MNRKETIARLLMMGAEIAEQMGYTQMEIGEDREKGIWGEGFTEFLEKKYGECTKIVRWVRKEKQDFTYGDMVQFSFRFSNPQLMIDHRKVDGSMAKIELDDFNHEIYQQYEKELESLSREDSQYFTKKQELEEKYPCNTGNFNVKDIQVFMGDHGKGLCYLEKLMKMWNDFSDRKYFIIDENIHGSISSGPYDTQKEALDQAEQEWKQLSKHDRSEKTAFYVGLFQLTEEKLPDMGDAITVKNYL